MFSMNFELTTAIAIAKCLGNEYYYIYLHLSLREPLVFGSIVSDLRQSDIVVERGYFPILQDCPLKSSRLRSQIIAPP